MFHTYAWKIYMSSKISKIVRQHWVYKTFLDKEKRRGKRVLDFRSENV